MERRNARNLGETLQQVKVVRLEMKGEFFLTRKDLSPLAQNAFTAMGLWGSGSRPG